MNHVLLISDNRTLLKQLYQYLEKEPHFDVLVVPFSTNTYERFVENQSDLIVYDTANMIPYRKILEQLTQSHWSYKVILLSDRTETIQEDTNVVLLEKTNLSKKSLKDTLMEVAKTQHVTQSGRIMSLNWNGQIEFISYPDAYYILYAKYAGQNEAPISDTEREKFKATMIHTGEVEMLYSYKRDLFLLMRRSRMHSGFEFSSLAKLVNAVFGSEYSIFTSINVSWTRLTQAYQQLTESSRYSYFLVGESIEISELNKRITSLPQVDIHEILWKILYEALNGHESETEKLLKELYLHQLKYSLDISMRGYIRLSFELIQKILVPLTHKKHIVMSGSYRSVECEYMDKERIFKGFCSSLNENKPLNPLVINAVTKIYKSYFEEISLESISRELCVNKNYLGRLFREQTGMTVLSMLQMIRYDVACYALKSSNLKISAVAKSVGYSDPGYFSRLFKKNAGISPEDYRISASAE